VTPADPHTERGTTQLEGVSSSPGGIGLPERLTTRPPIVDIEARFPEMRSLRKPAIRLFPRPASDMEIAESKLGGSEAWPRTEKWPICPKHEVPFVSLIQIIKSQTPQFPFRPGADVFQIIWCPHTHKECEYLPDHRIFWRNLTVMGDEFAETPAPRLNSSYLDTDAGQYVPAECRFHPEEIIEFPAIEELPDEIHAKIESWDLSGIPGIEDLMAGWRGVQAFPPGEWLYITELSTAAGTKLGGYPEWIQYPEYPVCSCGNVMEHLLSISSLETAIGEEGNRWIPQEERNLPYGERYNIHYCTNLMFGDGGILYVFVCRRCEDWPIKLVWQSG